jgi:hypothetical protein
MAPAAQFVKSRVDTGAFHSEGELDLTGIGDEFAVQHPCLGA